MSLTKEINDALKACDKVPLAKRCTLWTQAWDAARSAAAASRAYQHTEARQHIRSAKTFLQAHKEEHK